MSRLPSIASAILSRAAAAGVLLGWVLAASPAFGQDGAGSGAGMPGSEAQVIGGGDLDPGQTPPSGTDIAGWLGAGAFYDAGYSGSRSVVATIEDNFVWNGHETLTHVQTFLYAVGRDEPRTHWHPTGVASLIGGRTTAGGGTYQRGVAPGATLWSGAFTMDIGLLVVTPYYEAMQRGVGGRRADVVNSSWGMLLYDPAATEPNPAIMMDALVAANRTTFVASAGNAGPGPNTVMSPGACYNTLAVGALAGPDYTSLASFSSRGGSDYRNPLTGETVTGVRATVDLVAPGAMLLMADYKGTPPAPNAYRVSQGTSFASPLAAGGAALLVDVGYDRFGGGDAVDGRVIASVLQNSARPLSGWDNGTRKGADGVWRTSQSLDWGSGAGALDLERGFQQYTGGTTNLPGVSGGQVQTLGWDFATVAEDQFVEYVIAEPIGGAFRSTLNWWVDRSAVFKPVGFDYDLVQAAENSFINLDLELWRVFGEDEQARELVAVSESLYNNTELLSLSLEQGGSYLLRVVWTGKNFDLLGTADRVDFALAWWGHPAPEPSGLALWACVFVFHRHRKGALRSASSDAPGEGEQNHG